MNITLNERFFRNEIDKLCFHLADLKRFTYTDYQMDGNYFWLDKSGNRNDPPQWGSDTDACLGLLNDLGISFQLWKGAAWVGCGDDAYFQREDFDNHPDIQTAARVAIIKASIVILENRKSN